VLKEGSAESVNSQTGLKTFLQKVLHICFCHYAPIVYKIFFDEKFARIFPRRASGFLYPKY